MNFDAYIGQAIEVEDSSAPFQCMDWAFFVCDKLGIPRAAIRNEYAKDVWTKHDPNYFTASATPVNGCFAIWGTAVGQAGHIAWVESGIASSFMSLDQNWNFVQHVTREQHTSFGVLGFLIPKGTNDMTNDTIEKLVSYAYRAATDTDPTPEQAGYWVERIKANQQTAPELLAGLGASSYQNEPNFREKARNYDKDVEAAKQGVHSVVVDGVTYEASK